LLHSVFYYSHSEREELFSYLYERRCSHDYLLGILQRKVKAE
jgi:hypothetical protein